MFIVMHFGDFRVPGTTNWNSFFVLKSAVSGSDKRSRDARTEPQSRRAYSYSKHRAPVVSAVFAGSAYNLLLLLFRSGARIISFRFRVRPLRSFRPVFHRHAFHHPLNSSSPDGRAEDGSSRAALSPRNTFRSDLSRASSTKRKALPADSTVFFRRWPPSTQSVRQHSDDGSPLAESANKLQYY